MAGSTPITACTRWGTRDRWAAGSTGVGKGRPLQQPSASGQAKNGTPARGVGGRRAGTPAEPHPQRVWSSRRHRGVGSGGTRQTSQTPPRPRCSRLQCRHGDRGREPGGASAFHVRGWPAAEERQQNRKDGGVCGAEQKRRGGWLSYATRLTPDGYRGVAAEAGCLVPHLQPGLQAGCGMCTTRSSWDQPPRCAAVAQACHAGTAPSYLSEESIVPRVHGAGKHGLLPHQHPLLVAGLVESICVRPRHSSRSRVTCPPAQPGRQPSIQHRQPPRLPIRGKAHMALAPLK